MVQGNLAVTVRILMGEMGEEHHSGVTRQWESDEHSKMRLPRVLETVEWQERSKFKMKRR